eukprot:CAMPEP_0172521614 /NCGR_PEP_ID=MMETSP1066-20121228/292682_1 /TAXON_ID=671091 /ORGANISM="Coscinodiscus wailesii, Strain CCMP2513" /LENGTH=270 /DNA_ID=CAMNT_0013304553 /DNA_START=90 /DNA_END=899 /DNA_ORIENTATION=-
MLSLFLKIIFSDKLETDIRSPFTTFELHGERFGLLLPSVSFWMQLFATLVIQSLLGHILSVIVYKFIVQRRGSVTAYLTGWGLVIPIVISLPFKIIRFLGVRNKILKMSASAIPTLGVFRCLEAMYGFPPSPATEAKLLNYGMYFSTAVEFDFDESTSHPVRVTVREIIQKIKLFFSSAIALGMLYSVLEPYSYTPFATLLPVSSPWLVLGGWLSLGRVGDNFLLANLTHLSLCLGTTGVSIMINILTGMRTLDITNNPIFGSAAPSDFW